jgi:diaminopimelate epimerase
VQLSKHEGAGNDFLVVVDREDRVHLGAADVRALCDRHRGIGADGVIRVGPSGVGHGRSSTDVWMELHNADGSEAEMSGNGIRCLAQAAVDAGLVTPPRFTVATAAGVRTVDYRAGERSGDAWASAEMGPARLGPEEPPGAPGHRARRVDVGNPHLVVLGLDDPDEIDLATVATRLAAGIPGGVNVELIAVGDAPDELRFRVWERGVGETLACGTGSVAAAAAARSWGLVGDRVLVRNPGGTLEVRLGPTDDAPAVLAGPVRLIAEVTVDVATLVAGHRGPTAVPA